MGKDKLRKFAEIKRWDNVFEFDRDSMEQDKTNWSRDVFPNNNPLVLELGCGHGEYSIELAKKYPEKNFVGVDLKGARLWKGAKFAKENNLKNVAFLRTEIELLDRIFSKSEVDEIWITFPDPQILYRRAKHRLTHPNFLRIYKCFLKPNGFIHLKTDDSFLHGYTLGLLEGFGCTVEVANHDIYNRVSDKFGEDVLKIQTHYERGFLKKGKKITYIKFTVDALRDV